MQQRNLWEETELRRSVSRLSNMLIDEAKHKIYW